LAVRLFRLEGAPLSTGEAQLALAALHGTPPPPGASPLLWWINSVLFAILGSGDGLARLVPALIGSALVAMPALLRWRLGRTGALGAAALLAISPVAIMASRTLGGDVIAAAVLVGLVAIVDRYLATGQAAWLYVGAAILGLGLASGCGIYSVLLVGAVSLITVSGVAELRRRWRALDAAPSLGWRLIGIGAAVFIASATALMWRPGGLSAAIDLLSVWLSGFRVPAADSDWYRPLQLLIFYEPLAAVGGIAGLFFAFERADRFVAFLGMWLISAAILAVFRAGHTNGDVLLVVLPLALLFGYAIETLTSSLSTVRFSAAEGVLILVLCPVIAYFMLGWARYIANPNAVQVTIGEIKLGPWAAFIPMLLALMLGVIVVLLFGALTSTAAAVRSVTVTILAVLAMATWAAGWGAAQVHPGDPREIIAGPETTSPAVRDLARDVAALSAQKTADSTTLPLVIYGASDSVLEWYLRDMRNVRFETDLDASSAPPALITTDRPPPATLADSFIGQRFTLRHEWHLEGKSAYEVLKWLMYRQAGAPTPTRWATLWVKQE